jgi:hypothetical protein
MVNGLLLLLLSPLVQAGQATLGTELLERNLPVPKDAKDLDQPITSYAVLDDRAGFVIGYYQQVADGGLHELHVRAFDKTARTWRSATFGEIGSVLSVTRHGGAFFLTGHSSPSAGPLLVLTKDLRRTRDLDGWIVLALDDGRVVFNRSMRHFAPTHAEALALYDTAADREISLYPPAGVENDRGSERVPGTDLWVDRSFSAFKKGAAPGTIEFQAVVQKMRLNDQQAPVPAGPEERLLVVCHVAGSLTCETRSATRAFS